jgi:hypothetical protein
VLFRNIALLDRFDSDVREIDLSSKNRTLKIRKIPKNELEEFLLTSEYPSSIEQEFRKAIVLGEDMYWLDYHYDVKDFQAMVQAFNTADEDKEKTILALRLLKSGCIRMIFNVKKGERAPTHHFPIGLLRSGERTYFLSESELASLKEFYEKTKDVAWERKKSEGHSGIALGRFTDGYERTRLEDKLIDYMIGLEALYLQGEGLGEFGYKMAHRAAVLLSDEKEERKKIFGMMKESYALRSKIVHGGKYSLSPGNVWLVEDILRESIRKLLETPKPRWLDLIF